MSAISITILLFCLSTCSVASTAEEEKQVEERSRPAPSELLLALDAPAQGNGGMQFSYNRDLVALRPKRCRDANLTSEPMFFCPTPNPEDVLEWVCVRASQLCNNVPDCPGGQDEHPTMCMFYNLQNAELNNIRRSVANFMVKQNEKNARRPKQSRIF